jgi:hypothetical protein
MFPSPLCKLNGGLGVDMFLISGLFVVTIGRSRMSPAGNRSGYFHKFPNQSKTAGKRQKQGSYRSCVLYCVFLSIILLRVAEQPLLQQLQPGLA